MRWLAILTFALATFAGCSLDDALENAPCNSDDDCLGDQSCVQTQHQLAMGEAGLCRSDGECAAGQQEGCITDAGACTALPLYVTCTTVGGAEACFCCNSSDASIADVAADGSSARCISCPPGTCQAPATETCSEGDARCVVDPATSCGCRVPADQIENSECADAESCGDGFVCTRTLEQEAESPDAEPLTENQAEEPGWCRPEDAPECVGGQQEGCRAFDGCPGLDLSYQCATNGRCYCCPNPADGNSFNVHVYAETGAGESAACVECPRSACDTGTQTCTTLQDATCVVSSGVCGCTPPM